MGRSRSASISGRYGTEPSARSRQPPLSTCQPSALADPGLTRYEHDCSSAIRGGAHCLIEGGQLNCPADQRSVPHPLGHGVIIALGLLAFRRELRDRSDTSESVRDLTTPGRTTGLEHRHQ
jgi:hypothetical protein